MRLWGKKKSDDRLVKLSGADVTRLTYVSHRMGLSPTEVVSTLIRDTYTVIKEIK